MSNSDSTEGSTTSSHSAEMMSALFGQLVMQQANMAMMLMGKVAHPESGQVIKDIEAARLFIDELEMLEVKTKGNLTREEAALLKQSLMSVRLAFVQAVDTPARAPAPSQPAAQAEKAAEGQKIVPPGGEAAESDEHRKKFTKKY